MIGFYIHIPFCLKKCAYCDFYSKTDVSRIEPYVLELEKEIRALSFLYNGKKIETIYFGGGTPGLLSVQQVERIISLVRSSFLTDLKEVTLEVNPSSVTQLSGYKAAGVTRISVGVQSVNDETLQTIGRLHTAKEAIDTIKSAHKAGFRVSADLMLALPNEKEYDIDCFVSAVSPYVNHVSAYLLKIEENTPLFFAAKKNEITPVDDDRQAELYTYAYRALEKAGFLRYEISNFAREGEQSLHNLIYWQMGEYFAAGAAAHGFLNGRRFYNAPDIETYLLGEHSGNGREIYEDEIKTLKERRDEAVMLSLRTAEGLPLNSFISRFGVDFFEVYGRGFASVKQYLTVENDRIFIKNEYLLLENAILINLLQ